jgi:protein-S-isoprenylcysteine O-methyltransferase Ste14
MENTIVDHAPEAQLADTPGVRIPPPLPFIGTFLVGWLIQSRFPLPFLANPIALIAGSLLLVCWAALVVTSIPTMIRRGGTLNTNGPSSTLVASGAYRVTRNPMYLSLVLGYAGAACLTHMLWPLILVPLPLLYSQLVILREERYLERRFGAAYLTYKSRVRRWL